jgi:hypothetical protein
MRRTYAILEDDKQFKYSKSQLLELKIALDNLGLSESKTVTSDLLIFANYSRYAWNKSKNFKNSTCRLILVRFEPIAVLPIQYKKRIEKRFDLILNPGGRVDVNLVSNFIGWPYSFNLNPSKPEIGKFSLKGVIEKAISDKLFDFDQWNLRKKPLVLIAANKVSPTSNSNYRIRRFLARNLSSDELHVYGALWMCSFRMKISHRFRVMAYAIRTSYFPNVMEIYGNLFAKYPTFQSEPIDKHEILKHYKFSLVIENSSQYCSEKLFDAIINGSIPIYIGPKSNEINLPEDLFLHCSGSIHELRELLKQVTDEQCANMLINMKRFIQSHEFVDSWQSDKVFKKIARILKDMK